MRGFTRTLLFQADLHRQMTRASRASIIANIDASHDDINSMMTLPDNNAGAPAYHSDDIDFAAARRQPHSDAQIYFDDISAGHKLPARVIIASHQHDKRRQASSLN